MSRVPRVAGACVTLLVALVGYWYLRPASSRGPDSGSTGSQRGGPLVATVRSEPRSFNRINVRSASAELLSLLTQGRLLRVNRSTFELEPWLADRWETAPDGLSHTLHLREGVSWSDGTPF